MKFEGDVPVRAEETEWEFDALFGFDPQRGVTVCVNQAGLWELSGTTWRKREVALDQLPKEAREPGYRSNGCSSVYDSKHQQLVFWVQDEDAPVLLAWNGEALTRLSMKGLPDALSTGFAIGDHPDHGLVLLSRDGELFGQQAPTGGFRSLGTAPGAPTRFSCALLAWHPLRKELVMGPRDNAGDSHQFFVFNGTAWKPFGRAIDKSVLEDSNPKNIATADGRTYKFTMYGAVFVWNDEAARWSVLLSPGDVDGMLSDDMHIVGTMWNGRVHGVTRDGACYRLEETGSTAWWAKVFGQSRDFGANTWPLWAFDVSRDLLVVWGDTKKSGKGVKNDTFTCDGKAWSKGKKSPAPVESNRDFTLVYAPFEKCVLRLSEAEVASFDGTMWTAVKHSGKDLASAWRLTTCVLDEAKSLLLVKQHLTETVVVRLERSGKGWAFSTVASYEPPKLAVPEEGRNSAFDIAWFDAAKKRLAAHFYHDAIENHALDLSKLFT